MRVLKLFITFAAVGYLLVVAVFFKTQRSLLYYPSHTYVSLSNSHASQAFREISVTTVDGLDLKAWYAPAAGKGLTIVFFHGNADSLSTAAQIADPYIAAGYGFLVAEYRGYSGLPGIPTEKGLYEDGRAYMRALIALGVPSQHVILFGHSLGTGVATEMAMEFPVGGLMLLAPYLSMPKVARVHFPFIPVSLIALDRYENDRKIPYIHSPLLIANGTNDEVIPPTQGRDLYSVANGPKEFHSIEGRGHNDAFDEFATISIDWMNRLCKPN